MPSDINICYFYRLSGYDYYYEREKLSDGNFRIHNEGHIKVDGINMTSIQNVSLSAENSAHTKRFHTNAWTGVTYQDEQNIDWTISENWGFPFKTLLVDIYEYM